MNIKITYDWLLEYLETDADPYEMQKYLSLSGPSIETVEKVGEDYVFDIEITSNRIDMASVFGIAQEAQAILPQFGKKAQLRFNPLEKYTFDNLPAEPVPTRKLNVTVVDPELCLRFTAMVISSVQIKSSPSIVKKRLELSGIRSLNNVIDISNYLMLSLGQPTHMFDFDQIKDQKMILRKSKRGEKITTLDGRELVLPGDDIVIEDGSGRIIDLCGIMGGENSSITENTKNILFFVQTYNKRNIRKTSMITGQRTMAATYFEKGLDPERVEPAFVYGTDLLMAETQGQAASELIDLYPHKRKEKHVKVYLKDIHRLIGVPIDERNVIEILTNLGFLINRNENEELAYPDSVYFEVTVPTYRTDDVNIKEDIIEEVARVYGYYNLPNNISPLLYIKQPREMEMLFKTISKTKHYLKNIGLNEFLNYSMVSELLLENMGMDPQKHLRIANSISKEIEYMRQSLAPSLVKNIRDNIGKKDTLKIFEVAKIYTPKEKDLPEEQYLLTIAVTTDFFDLKGIVEGIFTELNIRETSYRLEECNILSSNSSTAIICNNKVVGRIGMLRPEFAEKMGLSNDIYIAEIDFSFIIEHYSVIAPFVNPITTAIIKLDVTIDMNQKVYGDIEEKAHQSSKLLQRMEVISQYKNNITIRFYFADPSRNITEEEAKKELEEIQNRI